MNCSRVICRLAAGVACVAPPASGSSSAPLITNRFTQRFVGVTAVCVTRIGSAHCDAAGREHVQTAFTQ